MKKIMLLILIVLLPLMFSSCKSNGVRSFYCLSTDKCITVWKEGSGDVYVVPTKYKKNKVSAVSHIKTNDKQFLTLYFSDELPNKIILRNEGNLGSEKKSYNIENDTNSEWEIVEYSDYYKAILYKENAVKFKDVKSTTSYLTLNINENYATDKTGKKIEQ